MNTITITAPEAFTIAKMVVQYALGRNYHLAKEAHHFVRVAAPMFTPEQRTDLAWLIREFERYGCAHDSSFARKEWKSLLAYLEGKEEPRE